MPTINSFPIQTKRVADLEVMAGSDISEQDKTLVYDQSLGLWKTVTIAESAYYSSVVFNTPAQAALASLPVGAKYSTKGANSVGDGGHGYFIVSDTALTTKDGYSCFELANGNYANLLSDGKNIPEQFGARNDATTDDGDALRRFIARFGLLRLKAGLGYAYTGTLNFTNSGSAIIGESSATVKLLPLTNFGDFVKVANPSGPLRGFTMKGVTIRPPMATCTQDSLVMDGVRNFTVDDVVLDRGCRGLVIRGCSQGNFDNITIIYENNNGGSITDRRYIYIEETSNANIGSKHPGDLFFSNLNGRCGATPYCYTGLEIHAADGIWFSNYHIGNCTFANVHINADRTARLTGLKFINAWHDIGTAAGVRIEGITPSTIGHYQFNSVRSLGGDTGASGYIIDGSAGNVKIGGDESSISGYVAHGIEILATFMGDLSINDTDIYDVALGGVYDAIVDRSPTSRLRVSGGEIRGSTYRWGINIQNGKAAVDIDAVTIEAGTAGRISYTPTAGNRIRNCIGFNPTGIIPVTIGDTPWTYVNNRGYPVTLYIGGGTVSGISVDLQATGLTSGAFYIPEGQSVTVNYTAAPTVRLRGC